MFRLALGALLIVLAIAVIAAGFSDGRTAAAVFENIVFSIAFFIVPAAEFAYFGWHARAAKSRLVTRRHAALPIGLGLAVSYAFVVAAFLLSKTGDRGASVGGATLLFALPAAILILVGWRGGVVEMAPEGMLPRAADRLVRDAVSSPDCAICGSSDRVAVYYTFPSVARSYGGLRNWASYDSTVFDAVRICDACVDRKRDRARPALWGVLVVSLPLCVFGVGVFGVLAAGMSLWDLRHREEIGDLMAADWRVLNRVTFWPGFAPEGGGLTRNGFKRAKAREGRDAFGRPTAVPEVPIPPRRPPDRPPGSV